MKHIFARSQASSEKGFSLMEIMVAIGVAGILTYVISQMLVNSGKQATSIASKTDFNSFVNELQGVFNNTGTCLKAFGGPGVTAVPATFPGATSISVGGNAYTANTAFGGPPTTGGAVSKRSMTISKLEFTDARPTGASNQFVVPLALVATRQIVGSKESAAGGNLLNHTFNLIVTLDAARKITGCAGQYTDFWSSTGETGNDIIYTGGNVAIGGCAGNTTDEEKLHCVDPPQAKLDVDGKIQATSFLYRSDARLKENVREIPGALERVLQLHGVLYDWKDHSDPIGSRNQLGLLAQEVEKTFPETVNTNRSNGMKTVGYGNLLAPLVEAIKEQQEIITRQEREIAELKKAVLPKQ